MDTKLSILPVLESLDEWKTNKQTNKPNELFSPEPEAIPAQFARILQLANTHDIFDKTGKQYKQEHTFCRTGSVHSGILALTSFI